MCKNKVQFQKGLSLPDFMVKSGTEAQCEAVLEAAKWPDGFLCGHIVGTSLFRVCREVAQDVNAINASIKLPLWPVLFFKTPSYH